MYVILFNDYGNYNECEFFNSIDEAKKRFVEVCAMNVCAGSDGLISLGEVEDSIGENMQEVFDGIANGDEPADDEYIEDCGVEFINEIDCLESMNDIATQIACEEYDMEPDDIGCEEMTEEVIERMQSEDKDILKRVQEIISREV